MTATHTHLVHRRGHVLDHEIVDRGSRLLRRPTEWTGKAALQHLSRSVGLERQATGEIARRVDEAHRDHCIGHRGVGAPKPVRRRPGIRPRALRADLRDTRFTHPRDRASPGADGHDIDEVDARLQQPDLEVLLEMDLVIDDDSGIEARAPHVAQQHVSAPHPTGELVGAEGAARGTRAEKRERELLRSLQADAAPQALEEDQAPR